MARVRFQGLALIVIVALGVVAVRSGGAPAKKPYELLPNGLSGPTLLAEGIVSTTNDETGGVFRPGSNEFYFTVLNSTTTAARISLLCMTRWEQGRWSQPKVVPFSGLYFDLPARFSSDGKTLYFSSSRPIPGVKER